jgi:hypothetical protein
MYAAMNHDAEKTVQTARQEVREQVLFSILDHEIFLQQLPSR